ncbi:MAG TPA: DUF4097 family beta strand repeat-containing protein [Acidobacteriota bacterium]|nr:DUF4097 family beta strand repeat-containing protein [Acidobacteriota bacterium]
MKNKGITLLTVIFAAFFSIHSLSAADKGYDIDRKFQSAPGKKLIIDLDTGGAISITGKSGNEVNVKVHLTGSDSEDLKVDVEETSNGIEINSTFHGNRNHYNASADLEIQTPSRYDVDLKTMGGDVAIHNLEGNISGETMGGELDLNGLKGKIQLTTMGGEITVADSDLDGSVKTMGGDVLIRNVSGTMKGSTMGGDVRYENATGGKVKGEVKVNSMGGDLNIADAPEGASLDTMGGDIHVTSAKKFVEAKTMGGDIQLDSVDGSVEATTMGGDVKVRITGDAEQGKGDVSLTSMGGDIELTVPAGMAMNIDVETVYSERTTRKPKIVSDFPLEISEREESGTKWHDKEITMSGTGQTGNGKHHVKIRTVGGDIFLRKGN